MKPASVVTCAALLASMATPVALGCGDKLALIGGGVGYDRLSGASTRGNVVLLVEPGSALSRNGEALKLKRALESAGHKVRAVPSVAALEPVIASGQADVVLVSWQDALRLQQELATRPSAPALLGIASIGDDADTASAPPMGVCVSRSEGRRAREVVLAVDQTVEQRRNGQPVECRAAPPLKPQVKGTG
jgi:hypothetical protein